MLLVNSRNDPITGYSFAANVARHFGDRAVLLTYDGHGHTAYMRSACVRDTTDRYLISQILPGPDTHC